jgi:hypothetical protein
MASRYNAHGVRFNFPESWKLTEEQEDRQVSITVSSPGTSFWVLSLFLDRPDPAEIVEAVLDAFRSEYREIDIYASQARVCRRPTEARDIDFVCLELLNSAAVRVFRTRDFTALVLYQGTERELGVVRNTFEKITRSLACTPEAD